MKNIPTQIGTTVRLQGEFDAVVQQVIDALKVEGFGVLTQIDVQATLKEKLGEAFRPYKILGACNPSLAHRALNAAPEVGLLLPCNVTVSEVEPGMVEVSLVDPLSMLDLIQNSEVEAVATEAAARLKRAAAALEG